MSDNIIVNPTVNSVSVTQVVNSVVISAPGPQGPTGQFLVSSIPIISPITNISGSIGFDQATQYITLDGRYAKITGSIAYSASSGSALHSASADYSSSANYANTSLTSTSATYASSALYSNNSASLGGQGSAYYAPATSSVRIGSTTIPLNSTTASLGAVVLNNSSSVLSPYLILNNTNTQPSTAQGTLYYETNTFSPTVVTDTTSPIHMLQQMMIRAVNDSNATITKGQAVYLSGAQGNRPAVKLAIASSSTQHDVIGVVYDDIAAHQDGWILTQGLLEGIDTRNYVEGAYIYLSAASAGYLTPTSPSYPNYAFVVAQALNSTVQGKLLVQPYDAYNQVNVNGAIQFSDGYRTIGSGNATLDLSGNASLTNLVVSGNITGSINYSSNSASLGGSAASIFASKTYADTSANNASATAYASAQAYANSASSTAYNAASAYALSAANAASSTAYSNASTFAVNAANSASLTAYNAASAYTAIGTHNNINASVGFALNSASLGGLQASDYAIDTGPNTFIGTQTFNGFVQAFSNQVQSGKMTIGQSSLNNNNQLTVVSAASTNIGLVVQGATSQTADLQQWQDSSGGNLARINSVGVGSFVGISVSGNSVFNYTTTFQNSAVTPLIAKNLGGSADIQQWQDTNGNVLARIYSYGGFTAGYINAATTGLTNARMYSNTASNEWGLVVRANSLQSADLTQWQNSSGTSMAGVTASGLIYTGSSTSLVGTSGSSAYLSVYQSNRGNPALVIRTPETSPSSSTGPYIQIVDGNNSSKFTVNQYGNTTANAGLNVAGTVGAGLPYLANLSIAGSNSAKGIQYVISAAPTQPAFEIINSTSTAFMGITASGFIYTGSSGPMINSSGSSAYISIYQPSVPNNNPNTGLVMKTASTNAGNYIELYHPTSFSNSPIFTVNNSGTTNIRAAGNNIGSLTVGTNNSNNYALGLIAITNQNQNLMAWTNVSTTPYGGINAIGQMWTGSTQPLLNLIGSTASIIPSAASTSASVYLTASHTLNVGQIVYISGVTPTGYNNTWAITSIPTASSFTIQSSTTTFGASATVQGSIYLPSQMSVIGTASNAPALSIQSASNQSSNILEIKDGTGTNVVVLQANLALKSNGSFVAGGFNQSSVGTFNSYITQPSLIGYFAKGIANQTGDFLQFKDSNSNNLIGITASGFLYLGASVQNSQTATYASPAFLSITPTASNPAIVIRPGSGGVDGNTNNIEIFSSSTATTPNLSVNKSGQLSSVGLSGTGGGVGFPATTVRALPNNNVIGLMARQASGQTADLLQIQQATTFTPFAGITASGQIYTGINTGSTLTTIPLTNSSGSYAQLSVSPATASNPGIIVRGLASQSANLLEIQNSSSVSVFTIDNAGLTTLSGNIIANATNGVIRSSGALASASTNTSALLSNYSMGHLVLQNVSTVPNTPTGAGVIYVESGSLKYKGPSGTVTTLAVP